MRFHIDESTITVNVPTKSALKAELRARFQSGEGAALATINLDHLVKLRGDAAFRRSYAQHEMVVADGWPIAWLSRIARQPVEKLPGSELVIPLARWAAEHSVSVAMIGSHRQALDDAATALKDAVPGLQVVYSHAPPMGFDVNGSAAGDILEELAQSGARLCFVALGAPKQEILAMRGRSVAPEVVFASVGAGLDFLGGHQKRAPEWVQNLGFEWLWRALGKPLTLGPRYLRCLAILPSEVVEARRLRD